MALIFLIAAILILLPDAYILFVVLARCSWWIKGWILLPTALYYFVIIRIFLCDVMTQQMLDLLFRLTLCVLFPLLLFSLLSLIGRGIGLLFPRAVAVSDIVALIVAVIWLVISLYGSVAGWKKITVEKVDIDSLRVPAVFKGYKIVQLSDFHIGTYSSSPQTVDKIIDKLNSLDPDIIVFTGDLVNSSASEIDEFRNALGRLHARDGVFSVLGNHDYCLYRKYQAPESPDKELAKVISAEKEVGWRMLRNEAIQIRRGTDSIALIGVDNAGSGMFPDKSDLKKALKGLPEDEFKILLSHDPSHWRREVLPASDIDLMLGGHTHAMQFRLGNWSPSKWVYPEWGGLYNEDGRLLYVSTGIGENIAFRFGAWPQIVLLTLNP